MEWSMLIDGDSFCASQLRIATAHRNCASFLPGAVQGSALRDYGGNRWDFREVFSFPGASKLLDADLVRVDDAVKFGGLVRVDDEVGERWRSRWKTFSSAPGEKR
jgi:hypothetical protein